MKNKDIDIISFDAESYLQDRGIDFATEGKNVSANWIETQCPFCGDDPSMHMGISPERIISCWRCGTKGSILKYIQAIENCTWVKAKKILNTFVDESLQHLKQDIIKQSVYSDKGSILPEGITNLLERHYSYLENRGFDPVEIEKKYKLKALGKSVRPEDRKFEHRIIIPLFLNKKAVNFTARDYTGNRFPKYVNQENENAVYPMKNCLYNLDTVRDIALVVEGVTDVWKMGDGAIATMGIQFTTAQINLLLDYKPKKVFVMFDSEKEAQNQAKKLATTLASFVKTEILELENGDPGELSEKEVNNILREIGLR